MVIFNGCGEVSSEDIPILNPTPTPTKTQHVVPSPDVSEDNRSEINTSRDKVRIIGKVTYDRVPVNKNGIGLDYDNIQIESAKWVKVTLVDGKCGVSRIVGETKTDENGDYLFNNIDKNQNLRVCVYSIMEEKDRYSVKVMDNTNADAIYVIESSLFDTQTSKKINLHAKSGWTGFSYTKTRQAAPFAILDSIHTAMKKVMRADPDAYFPPLKVNWSVNNVPSFSPDEAGLREGLIGTSYFNGEDSLYILGYQDVDTDEYDDHIIIHEWGHYFEEKFSRSDSIGGSHGSGERLDIRVSFGEGWGNAFSAIATDDPIYFDTQGPRQSEGFFMDIESEPSLVKGFYSEDSIQHILYDIYDFHDDGADTLSMGFSPIYKTLTTFQKNTKAFTSIFTFIVGLEEQNPESIDKIDAILASENIAHIDDIYGSNIDPTLYMDLESGDNICTYGRYGSFNKLYNHKYVRFNIPESKYYIITVTQNNGSNSDPDFGVYLTSPFKHLGDSQSEVRGVEKDKYLLERGDYLLDVMDYNALPEACFDVIIK